MLPKCILYNGDFYCCVKFTFNNKKRRFHWLPVFSVKAGALCWQTLREGYADEDNYGRSSRDSPVCPVTCMAQTALVESILECLETKGWTCHDLESITLGHC